MTKGQETILTDPAEILVRLVRCASVTPEDNGAQTELASMLQVMGFDVEHVRFSDKDTPDVDNLYARLGSAQPHLMFAGHTDVVPPGEESAWSSPPFSGEIRDSQLYGRGAVDMKGGIACFVAAIGRLVKAHGQPNGAISLLITGDEEGPSINGSDKLLQWAVERGEKWDAALVGEPTNPGRIGDAIKIGRRGSISGRVTVTGRQGHVAYPHLANNPINSTLAMARSLLEPALDEGSDQFQPTNLELTSIDVGNPAANVIPHSASFSFNIRFNDLWDAKSICSEVERRLALVAEGASMRRETAEPIAYEIEWIGRPSPVFLTRNSALIAAMIAAVESVSGQRPALSTDGGTSDARFIKDYCPVIEFGLIGKTMHQIDERVDLADLEMLTEIYRRFIISWFDENAIS